LLGHEINESITNTAEKFGSDYDPDVVSVQTSDEIKAIPRLKGFQFQEFALCVKS
jgi:hypothetical protein